MKKLQMRAPIGPRFPKVLGESDSRRRKIDSGCLACLGESSNNTRMRKALVSSLFILFACAAYAQAPQKTGVLREAVQIPIVVNAKQVGVSAAAVGTKVQVVSEDDGKVQISVSGGHAWVASDKVDVSQAASASAQTPVSQIPSAAASEAKKNATPVSPAIEGKNGAKWMRWYHPKPGKGNDFLLNVFHVLKEQYGTLEPASAEKNGWCISATKESVYDESVIKGWVKPPPIEDFPVPAGKSESDFDAFVYSMFLTGFEPDIKRQLRLGAVVFVHEAVASYIKDPELKSMLPLIPVKSFDISRKGNLVVYSIEGHNDPSFAQTIGVNNRNRPRHDDSKNKTILLFIDKFMAEAGKKR